MKLTKEQIKLLNNKLNKSIIKDKPVILKEGYKSYMTVKELLNSPEKYSPNGTINKMGEIITMIYAKEGADTIPVCFGLWDAIHYCYDPNSTLYSYIDPRCITDKEKCSKILDSLENKFGFTWLFELHKHEYIIKIINEMDI